MHALVYTRPGLVENLDVEEPRPGPDEVLVQVAAVGICGSETHGIGSPGFRQPPLVMGHEFAGTLPDGTRVVVNPVIPCRTCIVCRTGQEQLCPQRVIIGIHRAGAFAERVVVPTSQVHPIPDRLGWTAAALVEPVANGLHAWDLAGRPLDARVGVIGAGPIGLAVLMAARADGVRVTIADLAPERLAIAAQEGAVTAPMLEGEFDVIIDAVGAPSTRRASVELLRPGGTAIWLGLAGPDPAFDAMALIRQGKTVRGSFCYPDATFARAIEVVADAQPQWADTFALTQGAEIFMRLVDGDTTVMKAVLVP